MPMAFGLRQADYKVHIKNNSERQTRKTLLDPADSRTFDSILVIKSFGRLLSKYSHWNTTKGQWNSKQMCKLKRMVGTRETINWVGLYGVEGVKNEKGLPLQTLVKPQDTEEQFLRKTEIRQRAENMQLGWKSIYRKVSIPWVPSPSLPR